MLKLGNGAYQLPSTKGDQLSLRFAETFSACATWTHKSLQDDGLLVSVLEGFAPVFYVPLGSS